MPENYVTQEACIRQHAQDQRWMDETRHWMGKIENRQWQTLFAVLLQLVAIVGGIIAVFVKGGA